MTALLSSMLPSLPALRGTDKQIEWATKIRGAVKGRLEQDFSRLDAASWSRNLRHSHIQILPEVIEWDAVRISAADYARDLLGNEDAVFWINNRELTASGASIYAQLVSEAA